MGEEWEKLSAHPDIVELGALELKLLLGQAAPAEIERYTHLKRSEAALRLDEHIHAQLFEKYRGTAFEALFAASLAEVRAELETYKATLAAASEAVGE